jgi:acyl-CoA thioester hydrolase
MQPTEHILNIRVRYPEVDAMGYLHHSRHLQYFEMGRVELLRSAGHSYADLERQGIFFAVVKVEVRYRAPARYDEELQLRTKLVKTTTVRLDHTYELMREGKILSEGQTTIACIDRQGQLQAIPDWLCS